MGLSNEERSAKIAFACRELYNTADAFKNSDDYDKFATLRDLCKNVWFAACGSTSNSLHWLLGSSASNTITKPDGLWPIAVITKLDEVRRSEDSFQAAIDKELDEFDPLDMLTVERLLGQEDFNGRELAATFKIFSWTEQLVYALRRYDDEFLDAHEQLSKLAAEISGVCFDIFSRFDNVFARAYLINEICKKLYRNKKFAEIADKQCWHHDLSKAMRERVELAVLLKYHKNILRNKKKLKTNELHLFLDVAFKLMGTSYSYEHNWTVLEKYLSSIGISDKFIKRLRNKFNSTLALRGNEEAESSVKYRSTQLESELSWVHGVYE